MPEANVLYGVTAVVVAGLVAWVAFVLKTAKEPWARAVPAPPAARASRPDDVPIEKEPIGADEDEKLEKKAEPGEAPQSGGEKAADDADKKDEEKKDEAGS
jgi:hypothetical protein